MALSGYKELIIRSGVVQKLSWTATKLYSTNSYEIKATLQIKRTDSYRSYGNCKAYIQIGESKSRTVTKYISMGGSSGSGYKTIMTYTVSVKADSNGVWDGNIISYITEFPGNALDSQPSSKRKITITPSIDKILKYTITYYLLDKKTVYSTQKKTEKTNISLLSKTPSITGYTFKYWESNGVKYYSGATYSKDANLSLYAIATANSYVVTFNPNTGTSQTTSKVVVYNSKYGTFPDVYRKGYYVSSWKNLSTGKSYTENSLVSTASNHTLTAQWSPIKYRVIFSLNGGTGTVPSSFYANYDQKYEIPNSSIKKTGYEFSGWSLTPDGDPVGNIFNLSDVQKDIYLYAIFTPKTYKVKFVQNLNGSTLEQEKDIVYDTKSPMFGDLFDTKGYSLKYWSTEKNGTGNLYYPNEEFDPIYDASDSSHISYLFGQWSANSYTLFFDSMGGTTFDSIQVLFGSVYPSLPTPLREGYTFVGWSLSELEEDVIDVNSIVSIPENHTVKAIWKGNQYVVTLDPNGGTVDPKNKTVIFGEQYGKLPIPSKEIDSGVILGSWRNQETGTGVTESTIVSVAKNHTLIANYDALLCDVNVLDVKTDRILLNLVYEQNSVLGEVDMPIIKDYTFKGLFLDKEMTIPIDSNYYIPDQEQIVIYAYYEPDGYIRMVTNGKLVKYKIFSIVSNDGKLVKKRMRPYFVYENKIRH